MIFLTKMSLGSTAPCPIHKFKGMQSVGILQTAEYLLNDAFDHFILFSPKNHAYKYACDIAVVVKSKVLE